MTGDRSLSVFAWMIAAATLLYYAFYQLGYAVNSDNALMVEYARRWLAGGTYGVDVFDPNPPASFLIYTPVVLLAKLMPVWHAITLYTSLAVLVSTAAVWALLRNCGIDEAGRRVITLAYLFGNLCLANIFFGERDHLILLGLMPFVLVQYGMLRGDSVKTPLQWIVLICGAILMMVKPHYGLMPVLMILYRGLSQKKITAVIAPDTIVLSVVVLMYAALLFVAFPTYLHDVMPLVASVYAPDMDVARLAVNGLVLFVAFLLWAFYSTSKGEKGAASFTLMLLIFALCLSIAGIAQLKGYYYHALPEFIILYVMTMYIGYQFIAKTTKSYALPFSVLLCLGCGYVVMQPAVQYPTHESFQTTNINQLYEGCSSPCSVFVFDKYPDIPVMASVYNDGIFASRFPSYWFLPEIVGTDSHPDKAKYQDMVAEDFARYRPEVVALVRTEVTMPDGQSAYFDFMKFFSENSRFRDLMKDYKQDGTFQLDRRDYHKGTTLGVENVDTFDLYRLKKTD